MKQQQPKTIYQPYRNDTQVKSFTLKPETIEGLNKLRKLFTSRFGAPTHSLILDEVLSKRIAAYEDDPSLLQEDVADFERRYGKKPK